MSSKRTFAERIAELKCRQKQLQEQERSLLARQTVEERKEKTKRHLRTGAAIETALGHPVTEDDLEQITALLARHSDRTATDRTHQTAFSQNRFPPRESH